MFTLIYTAFCGDYMVTLPYVHKDDLLKLVSDTFIKLVDKFGKDFSFTIVDDQTKARTAVIWDGSQYGYTPLLTYRPLCRYKDDPAYTSDRNLPIIMAQLEIGNLPCPALIGKVEESRSDEVWYHYCWHKCPLHGLLDPDECYTCPANI